MNISVANSPKVTVIMPVYNGGKYLLFALESILNQTFTDFELIIIDDASTDASHEIITSFNDTRMKVIRNAVNYGVAHTLNQGLKEARGIYVARMDADDISLPERLEEQVRFLDAQKNVAVLGVKALLIDCMNSVIGCWKADTETSTFEQIRRYLPNGNCIAHPGVMMRKEIISRYLYNERQLNSQDYDLWLRLVADNHVIDKLDKFLIKHRVHAASITYKSRVSDAYFKDVRTLYGYLLTRKWKLNGFDLRVGCSLIRKFAYWMFKTGVMKVREVLKQFFVRIGQLVELIIRNQKSTSFFFIFPVHHIGGAEKVHCDILKLVSEQRPWILFSDKSKNDALRDCFENVGVVADLSCFLKNIFLKLILLGFWSSVINRTPSALVFGSNSAFFYELIPYLNDNVYCIDLVHALGGGIDSLSMPFATRLNKRITVNGKTLKELRAQYEVGGLSKSLADRILLIENKVFVPDELPEKRIESILRIVYVGRGTEEKRVHLVGRIAHLCHDKNIAVEFTLVGDVEWAVNESDRPFCRFVGEICNQSSLNKLYSNSDIILVTSRREGFPMVIMEAMAYGVIPISTDVGGINFHVHHGENGFLVTDVGDESAIVVEFLRIIYKLSCSHSSVVHMSHVVHEYAKINFISDTFDISYRDLFENYKQLKC